MSSEQSPNQAALVNRVPMAQPQQQMAITPAEIMRILMARMWLIILVTSGIFILFVGLFFALRSSAPEYTSEAYVEAKTQASVGLWGVREMLPRKEILAMETAGVSAILNSDAFLSDVLTRKNVQSSNWAKGLMPDKRVEALKKKFSAVPIRDTAYIRLVFKAGTAEDAQNILNELLQQFEKNIMDDATGALSNLRASLEQNKKKLESDQTEIQLAIQALTRGENVPPGWQGGGMTVVGQRMQILSEEMVRLEAVLGQLNLERQQLSEQQQAGGLEQIALLLEQDPVALGLKKQIMDLEQYEAQKMARFGDKHPEVVDIRDAIQSAKYQLADRQAKMSENYTGQLINDNARQIQLVTEQLTETKRNYDLSASQQRDLDQKALVYTEKMRLGQKVADQLVDLQKSIDEINAQVRSKDNQRAIVKNKANLPTEMSFPKLPMFVAGGLVLGLMSGCGLAFLLELLNDTVRTPTDVRRYLNVPLLGLVPEYDQGDIDDLARILISRPSCITSEFIRQARTNLLFSAPADTLKTLLFTSCQAESGKTTMACCMAISLAQENKKVLLIDANFYRPALRNIFPAPGTEGLSNYLTGQNSVADVIHKTEIENLSVLYSGPKPPNPAGLFGGEYMAQLLKSQRAVYDYVIIDGPPSLIVLDSRVISSQVDGTIAVVFAEEESRGMVNRMVRELKQMKANIVGILLNGAQYRKGGYFKEAYKTYHDYVESDTVASK
ncbi:MAG: polysaccharide biosynthesis tyrosine autokinase [Sedimentisphaerales bacterium]|nr:polysaccharide biosynthesis tyrosine autokinase [Sedimentisphaerales bacterium]MBN2843767.1 polysaccharide biosynthesis tyrosine autokinase [Sedimentisphaerales bacterium]